MSKAIGSNVSSPVKTSKDKNSKDIFSSDSKNNLNLILNETQTKDRAYLGKKEIELTTTIQHSNGNSDKTNTETCQMEKEEISDLCCGTCCLNAEKENLIFI